MDYETETTSRERAISSEPSSTRPNPFDDSDHSSRKRRRLSRSSSSRSRSVDTAKASSRGCSMAQSDGSRKHDIDASPPHTPIRSSGNNISAEPTSSKVTINLRNRPLDTIPSSPPSPMTPVTNKVRGASESVESESDALSTVLAIETPSSSASVPRSPEVEVELVFNGDDPEFVVGSPGVAIINEEEVFSNPMYSFPFHNDNETLVATVRKLSHFIHYEQIEDDNLFQKLRDWIDHFLAFTNNNMHACHDSYVQYHEFWLAFPDIVQSLSWRSRFFGSFLQKLRDSRQALSDMLSQFARLTGRFVTMDVFYLAHQERNNSDEEPDLASRGYLQVYSFLLRKDEQSHIGRNLETHYRWNWDEDVAMMTSNFQIAGGTLHNLTRLVDLQLKLVSRYPKIIDNFAEPSRLVARTVFDAFSTLEEPEIQHPQYLDKARQQVAQGFEFFKIMAPGLKLIIEKHVTNLTPDCASIHLASLASIYRKALASDVPAARETTEHYRREQPGQPKKHYAKVVSFEWKFNILKSLITSAQMQLRVVGVTTMCQDLLSMYSAASRLGEPSQSPLLLHFAQFILKNKLVDYVVGIGSHPEIINESNNLVGFLIVTKTYSSQQTDKIWQTVMASQDPRVTEAILRMLVKCSHLFDYPTLLHFCEKASSLPIDAFTVTMRDYCENLFQQLVTRSDQESPRCTGAAPYELCVRLIRESSVISTDYPIGYPEIQSFAAARFRELLLHGPGSDVRNEIYLNCIADISSGAPTAPGSICVINTLLRQNMGTDLYVLTTEHGLIKLVIEELETTVLQDRNSSYPSIRNSPASQARRELLLSIMVQEPDTITPELGARLWNLLVGCDSKSGVERNTSWQVLNSAVKKTSLRNPFIAACFREYLPKLAPQNFTLGALDFARAGVFLWLDEVRRDFLAEDRSFDSPALEQLWGMILTAPPNTIDAPAINMLVEVYVDSALILSLPREKARSIHLALIHRCIGQLAEAASQLKLLTAKPTESSDQSMDFVGLDDQFKEQEKIFARSLAMLREFLRAYQSKPQFAAPKTRAPLGVAPTSIDGEPFEIKYQSFDENNHSGICSLTTGSLNNAASLLANLQKVTGFESFKVYCGGKNFDPDETQAGKPLSELGLRGLLLIQRREDIISSSGLVAGIKTTLELEIMKHFDELFGYLGMHESVAQEIYYFLVKFPVSEAVLLNFDSDMTTYTEIFPFGQPFKSLYTVHALREYIKVQSKKGSVDESALTRVIALIVGAIVDRRVVDQCPTEDLRNCVALHLVDCFVQLVKEPVISQQAAACLNAMFLQRMLELLYATMSSTESQNSLHLTWSIFEALLEASLHSPELWTSFRQHLDSTHLLRDLLLNDERAVVRKSIAKQILSKCNFTPSLARVSSMDFVVTFWPMVATLIPLATRHSQTCEESFSLSLVIFKRLAESAASQLSLNDLIQHWAMLLLSHAGEEAIGRLDHIDMVAQGLANLLYAATSYAKASHTVISCSELGPDLFEKHLFPPISIEKSRDLDESDSTAPTMPILNPLTRQTLAEAIFFLVKDDERQYKAVLMQLQSLVPYDDTVEDGPYQYELPFQFDRSKAIRSSTGYVGLRNLSNTCYLNSLFTQLYMNVPFREFMLDARVADGGSQKLLSETQTLFSFMQNSLRRFVDPVDLANSIRTYEETNIDVSIQMDVDEFYNLIFDRWESQILAPEAKKKFRSFYGGQLVQQVKSKECSHISERLEPFSAIQCDIKGKSTLQESLQAYVDGEVMEGDNKYKCSTCDRHVDAVKRACLRDVPDNLIFHLKRFDFNLRTLQRSKINDYFSFPNKIDMRPYKLEHLMSKESPEDPFELVGILVHSGTAESGHYYSFVRERPSTNDGDHWVEFNDDTVSPWDPSCTEGSCFGGVDFRGPMENGNLQCDKSYSAYMLFYQRSSLVTLQREKLIRGHEMAPVRLPVKPRLSNQIAMENELLVRKYCLYDSSSAKLVIKMLSNIKNINRGRCSVTHALEKDALVVALNHLDQAIARTKDLPDHANFMIVLNQICHTCPECSRDFLEWCCDYPDTLRHLLLRNPDTTVRADTAALILSALIKVKADASYAYGIEIDEDVTNEMDGGEPVLVQRVVKSINKLWDMFQSNCRAWPEYFGLLAKIAALGDAEAVLLLDFEFLRRTLEVVTADPLLTISAQYSRMLNLIAKRLATRPVSYDGVIGLLARLLEVVDPAAPTIIDQGERLELPFTGDAIPLTKFEHELIQRSWSRSEANILVQKLLHINQNWNSTRSILVKLLHSPPASMDLHIYHAIVHGIRKGSTTPPSKAHMRAAVVYCEHSEAPRAMANMVGHVTKMACHVETTGGREYLEFFRQVLEIPRRDETLKGNSLVLVISQVGSWAPALLTYYDATVRTETEQLVRQLVFREDLDIDQESSSEELELGNIVSSSRRRLGISCLDYLHEVYIRQRQQAVRANMASILNVIEECGNFFGDDEDVLTARFASLRAAIIPALHKATVEEADEEISDWDGSDGEYGSSEPMDSIAELCGNVTDDLEG